MSAEGARCNSLGQRPRYCREVDSQALKARNKISGCDFISPLQGEEFVGGDVVPGHRAARFALGYFISRLQREEFVSRLGMNWSKHEDATN
jgi:hypothetical protein